MKAALAAAMVWGAGIACSQVSSTVSLSNGVQLSVSASLGAPTGQETLAVQLTPASGNSFYRIFRDQNNVSVFAYELEVGRVGDSQFRLTVKSAGNDFAARFPNADGGKPTPTVAATRDLPLLRSGERSILNLFQIPGMGLQVTDSFQVKLNETAPGAPPPARGAIQFVALQVSLNHRLVSIPGASVAGRYAMFYIPGHGGYFFSSEPVPGKPFIVAGSVDRNQMHFSAEADTFDCTAASPIFPNLSAANVWLYHDPNYKPTGNWTRGANGTDEVFFTAAADSLSWWLR